MRKLRRILESYLHFVALGSYRVDDVVKRAVDGLVWFVMDVVTCSLDGLRRFFAFLMVASNVVAGTLLYRHEHNFLFLPALLVAFAFLFLGEPYRRRARVSWSRGPLVGVRLGAVWMTIVIILGEHLGRGYHDWPAWSARLHAFSDDVYGLANVLWLYSAGTDVDGRRKRWWVLKLAKAGGAS